MMFRIGVIWLLCLVILSFQHFGMCDRKKVSLSWRRDRGHLCFVCDVKNLSLGVSFEDPHGNTRGHCTAPIPHTVAGHCDSHLKQNIFNETTILTIDRVDCENGLWKCSHGENTNEYATASVSVSFDSTEQNLKDLQVRGAFSNYGCALISLIVGYVIALFFLSSFKCLKKLYETGYHCETYCKKTSFLTNLQCMCLVVVAPIVVLLILNIPFALIHEVCEGHWWVLGTTVGVTISSAIFYKLLVWKERSAVEIETRNEEVSGSDGEFGI